jgi:aminoglycoside 3-N-acetyltransferase
MGLATVRSLTEDLRALGVRPGDVLMTHSSYKSVGAVAGGPQAVVQALLDAVGPAGTLVVPTHNSENTDPAGWRHPPVPPEQWETIRRAAPGFDLLRTPASRWMGRLAELVRTWPGAVRSDHPQVSVTAIGPHAAGIVAGHGIGDSLGDGSPLGAVYRLDGKVLLLGAGHDSNTSLHLSECRQSDPPTHLTGSSIRRADGTAEWVTWTEVAEESEDFDVIGVDFEATGAVAKGRVGRSTARLMSQRALVDFGTKWIHTYRGR